MEILVDKFYLAAIAATVPGLGKAHIFSALEKMGSAKVIYNATFSQLKDLQLFEDKSINNFIQGRDKYNPNFLKKICEQKDIHVISFFDNEYPLSLKEIHNPPLVLYVIGNLPKDGYNIAIVGARMATPYGIRVAKYFAKAMVAGEITVISGGAIGIDSAAHIGVLEDDGTTVAVLGCGVDVVYPSENKNLFQKIIKKGALVSEYPPGTYAQARFFPARNRIIVGLSRGVIVCEAAIKSGALITARCAVDEQREVYCVPGNIFESTSVGCHNMIQQGAQLIDDARQIFFDKEQYYLKFKNHQTAQTVLFENSNTFFNKKIVLQKPMNNVNLNNLSLLGRKLYNLIIEPVSLDVLVEKTGANFTDISMELLDMQVMGIIDTDQTQRYFRI